MFIICSHREINFILSSQIWGNRKKATGNSKNLGERNKIIERNETWEKDCYVEKWSRQQTLLNPVHITRRLRSGIDIIIGG